jgi:hypothetical protein
MKRAIFKMGNYFVVESRTASHCFKVEHNIEAWSQRESWDFNFTLLESEASSLDEAGTNITVTSLHEGVSGQFGLETFITELINQLQAAQQISLDKGLKIILNEHELHSDPVPLYYSDQIQPGYSNVQLEKYPKIDVKIYTGLSERDLDHGGWYLFCNSRLVLYADQTADTGWGEKGELAKYHPDFAFARGYVYFASEDASLLPWNTTKTGVDTDSPIFKAARQEMVNMMRPVTRWLRALAAEENDDGDLHLALAEAQKEQKSLSDIRATIQEQPFKAPERIKPKSTDTSIQYRMSKDRVERVKEQLNAGSNSEVGRQTFEYYYALEIDD